MAFKEAMCSLFFIPPDFLKRHFLPETEHLRQSVIIRLQAPFDRVVVRCDYLLLRFLRCEFWGFDFFRAAWSFLKRLLLASRRLFRDSISLPTLSMIRPKVAECLGFRTRRTNTCVNFLPSQPVDRKQEVSRRMNSHRFHRRD